ncbi:MAG TPA: hypothetical protein VEI07_09200, partial [Planctomycetaceae bacterium]|nr:hypothetical protein [Planctomycetaceae bacterium]
MKLAVPNLKTLDYKQLGIDHGEKLAIAIIGLLLLLVLWSTKWTHPIKETPAELINTATTTDEEIKKNPWGEDQAKLLKTGTDLTARATALLTPMESSPWVLPIALNKPYHPERSLITRPKWLAVKYLVADATVVDLEMDPKVARLNEGFKKLKKEEPAKEKAKKSENKEKEPEEPPDLMEEFKKTTGGGDVAGGGKGGLGGFGRGLGGGKFGGMGRGGMGGRIDNKAKRQGRRRKKG